MRKWLIVGMATAGLLPGASTATWEMNSFAEFVKGKLEAVSLLRSGRIQLAPRTQTLFTAEQPVIWSLARGPQGSIYVATGHRGQIYQVQAGGKAELLWTAPEPEVFAITTDRQGRLFAATSPDGKIYRIENGRGVVHYEPKVKYIWSLVVAPDGTIYAGTGEEGKVLRISAAGQGEVYYESGQSHVTSLALDRQGRLLAGSEPNGILYRITEKGKAFVLYDAPLPEIRAIVPAADGSLYVAALGGAFGKKQAGAAGAVASVPATPMVTAPTTTITVEAAQAGIEIKPKADAPKPSTPTPSTTTATAAPLMDLTGVDRAAVYRIGADNLVETLWLSKEENIYDVVPGSANSVLFSTDLQGRIYRLEADRKATLLVETREGEATRLLESSDGILAATSHAAKLLRLGGGLEPKGMYESPVHDASNTARWGRVQFHGQVPNGARIAIRTRTGNSARPDETWSEWSGPLASGDAVPSPNARYIQWRAELAAGAGQTPELESVTIAYLPPNAAPVVKSVQVSWQATPANVVKAATAAAANSVYTVTVSDGGDTAAASTGTPTTAVARPGNGQLVLTWQSEDTDGDRLAYAVWFRAEDEREWKPLKTNWPDQALTLDVDSFADGKYFFRVVATDAGSNASGVAREGELVSAPVWIDNTPPLVKITRAARGTGGQVELEVEVTDSASPIRRAEVAVNAGIWQALAVADQVADSVQERFLAAVAAGSGEVVLTVRAFDAAGNAGTAKVVLR